MSNKSWVAFFSMLVAVGSGGCSTFKTLGDTVAHPGQAMEVMPLANDGSTLPVVVQRADAASTTATEVDRLLTATPTDDDAAWVVQAKAGADSIPAREHDYAKHPYYEGKPYKVVHALIWADVLTQIKSDSGSHPSLLAAISPDLGDGYAKLQAEIAAIGATEASIESEKQACKKDDIAAAERAQHEAKIDALNKQLDQKKDGLDAKKEAYVATCKAAAAKASPEARKRFSAAIEALRSAVHDARVANAAATIRYPLVAQSATNVQGTLLEVVRGAISDYVYEHTGKRLSFGHLQAQIVFENNHVTVALNGVTPEAVADLAIDELIVEVVARTEKFAGHAVTLLLTNGATTETLAFQSGVLDGISEGFAAAPARPSEPAPKQDPNVAVAKATAVEPQPVDPETVDVAVTAAGESSASGSASEATAVSGSVSDSAGADVAIGPTTP